ncbi:O- case-like [Paramuricea clavata]|uniref:O- case-like n=2 Tax=Paramuricea clavata TaxID=317549 RepID=A0A6S7JSB8_PARCT|nr:O- case-like [Paramuricea clavata]
MFLDSKTKKRKEKSFIPDDPEPWVIRGGICGEMQRLLPMLEGGSDLFTQGAPQVPTSSVYTIRPFTAADKAELYEICLSTCDDGQDGHDLFPKEPNMAGDR